MGDGVADSGRLTYLITGGTGTLGTAFTHRLIRAGHRVRVFARSEFGHERLDASVPAELKPRLSSIVGDVRDRHRIKRAMEGVDIVIHAAAMKRIGLCEYNPWEAVEINVAGTHNVAQAVIDCDVSRAIFVSSDKARSPCTHYGACKLAAEKLWLASNAYLGPRGGRFVAVAYGNVMGSRGSALHVFREQARHGTFFVTDRRCTRFHIRLGQAVDFIMRVQKEAAPGELWIPALPSFRVIDLAQAISPSTEMDFVGLRANEKIHEVLISEDEATHAQTFPDRYILTPNKQQGDGGWSLHSGRNTWRLSVQAIRDEIKAFETGEEAAWMGYS